MGNRTKGFNVQAFLDSTGLAKRIVEYRRDEAIFAQGERGDTVMYIQKGGVKLSVVSRTGKEAVVAMLGNGSRPLRVATPSSRRAIRATP